MMLQDELLIFTNADDATKVLGRVHMSVGRVLENSKEDQETDLNIHTGMFDVKVRTNSIQEKIQWQNALASSIEMKPNSSRSSAAQRKSRSEDKQIRTEKKKEMDDEETECN
jgi:hypothetical protein